MTVRLEPWFKWNDRLHRAGHPSRDAYQPPIVPENGTPWLPHDMTVYREPMRSSPYMAFVHGFLTFPGGGDVYPDYNDPDWYNKRLPGGSVKESNGDWLLRDKPWYPVPHPRASEGGIPPRILDRIWDCQQAEAAGFDGEFPDVLNLNESGDNRWGQLKDLVTAAGLAFPDFRYPIFPMLDGNTSVSRETNRATLITKLSALVKSPAIFRQAGRLKIAVYMPEGGGPASKTGTPAEVVSQWSGLQSGMAAVGEPFDYTMCTQRGTQDSATPSIPGWAGVTRVGQQGYGAALAPISERLGRWGSRNPLETLNPNSQNAGAAAYALTHFGLPWLAPVSVRDSRPNQAKYEECLGFAQLRASFQVAYESGATWVQVPTRSDMAEHAHTAPSINHGYTSYDLISYYLTHFKMRVWPEILTDTVYITHRIHRSSGYTVQTSGVTVPVRAGSTPVADIVEAFVFLTDTTDTSVRITSGGVPTTFNVTEANKVYGGPGVYSFTVDLLPGAAPSAQIIRDGQVVAQVTSKFAVTTTPITHDFDYRSASSGRQATGSPV